MSIVSILGYRQAVRQRPLTPSYVGSNPTTPASNKKLTLREIFYYNDMSIGHDIAYAMIYLQANMVCCLIQHKGHIISFYR